MVHYYFVDHSKQQSSGQSDGSDRDVNQQLPLGCSAEILHGNFFLFGQAVWIICQLLGKISSTENKHDYLHECHLVDKLLTITDLDPIRRYLAPSDRPKPNSRYSSIQVNHSRSDFLYHVSLSNAGFFTLSIHLQYS